MKMRPATPLAVLLFVAFVFLLLSVLSTPIIKAIPLGSNNGFEYGVFGFCKGSSCSGIKVGYTNQDISSTTGESSPSRMFSIPGIGNSTGYLIIVQSRTTLTRLVTDGSFTLPASTRHSLSAILVVHPIAALLTLICFILAVTSHVHSAAHSSKFHLSLIILLLPTILITLLAFLVDILLFIPHLAWGGWLVLAATILLVISGVVTCAMRRMLVSRKARQRRIADNPDMNGQNAFEQSFGVKADSPPPLHQEPTAPMMNGGLGQEKPGFATFDSTHGRRMSEDDRVPLNSRAPSAPSSSSGTRPGYEDGLERYGGSQRGGMGGMRGGRGGRMYNEPRDEFGNPLPPSGAFGTAPGRRSSSEQRLRHQYSGETMNSQGPRGRGRGGYPPRVYGRGGPYGPGRGGPGMNGSGRGGIPLGPMVAGAGAGMMAGEMMGRGQRGPPPGYGPGYPPQGRGGPPQYGPNNPGYGPAGFERRQSPGPPSAPGAYSYGARGPSPVSQVGQRYRQGSDPPPMPLQSDDPPGIGQAIEMDATTGSPQMTPGFDPPTHHQQLRESDSDVQGLIGLQQHRIGSPLRENPISPTSAYSGEAECVPLFPFTYFASCFVLYANVEFPVAVTHPLGPHGPVSLVATVRPPFKQVCPKVLLSNWPHATHRLEYTPRTKPTLLPKRA